MQQLLANLSNVWRISRIVDHGGAILTNVSTSPRVEGVGCQVSIFEECIVTFASARKHRDFTMFLSGRCGWGDRGGLLDTFVKNGGDRSLPATVTGWRFCIFLDTFIKNEGVTAMTGRI